MRQPSPRETQVFEGLCGPVTAADLAALRASVQRHKTRPRPGALANRFGVVLHGEWLERPAGGG